MKYQPKLHRDRDLKGATPETLARALLRPRNSAELTGRRKVSAKKVTPNHTSGSVQHLVDGI